MRSRRRPPSVEHYSVEASGWWPRSQASSRCECLRFTMAGWPKRRNGLRQRDCCECSKSALRLSAFAAPAAHSAHSTPSGSQSARWRPAIPSSAAHSRVPVLRCALGVVRSLFPSSIEDPVIVVLPDPCERPLSEVPRSSSVMYGATLCTASAAACSGACGFARLWLPSCRRSSSRRVCFHASAAALYRCTFAGVGGSTGPGVGMRTE
jgi:hypothetical protein